MKSLFKFISKEKASLLPKVSGVYSFWDERDILYIGKAVDLRERVKNHFQNPSFKDTLFLHKVKKIGYLKTNAEIEALILEAKLIKEYQPKFNILWRDSKNYFFVAITKEEFPRVFLTHQKIIKKEAPEVEIEYIGPFVDGRALKKTLYLLRKIFPYFSSKKHPSKKCQWCHLNLCPGPKPNKKEYQENINKLKEVLKGKRSFVLKELKKEMKKLAREERFEEASKIKDQIFALEKIFENAKIFEREIGKETNWKDIENKLKDILKVKKISKIEAFDISQIQGKFAVGSMVVFKDGKLNKKLYRRFKIKFTKKPSDFDMIKEIIERRLKHKEWDYPEIILIDGGKGQLNCAKSVKDKYVDLKDKIKIISLAKPQKQLFVEGKKEPFLLKNLSREIFNVILTLDKEAHRFAISYHKKLREKDYFQNID